jgi:hypothetical protein
MKVVMPNNYAIYLHDTPSKAAFKRPARAYSHGCIRTEDPLAFAELLLGNPEWNRAKIDQTIAEGKTVQAQAAVPTPVYITYFTAAALSNAEGIISYPDVYGRDGKVVTALNAKGRHDPGGGALGSTAVRQQVRRPGPDPGPGFSSSVESGKKPWPGSSPGRRPSAIDVC